MMLRLLLTLPHIDLVVSGLSFVTSFLAILKTRASQIIGFCNQGFWLIFMYQTRQFGLVFSISLFAALNIWGFYMWTRSPPRRGKEACECGNTVASPQMGMA